MSASSSSSPDDSDQLLLRWSDNPDLPSHEEWVQMLEAKGSEYVIRSSLRILEKTRVYLVGRDTSEAGIVRSCRRHGIDFILTIGISPEGPVVPRFGIDPGVFIVDSFLTEEQELQILGELEEELRSGDQNTATMSVQQHRTTSFQGTATLNRIVRFTMRSSTALVSTGVFHFLDKFRQITGTCTAEAVSEKTICPSTTPSPSPSELPVTPGPSALQ